VCGEKENNPTIASPLARRSWGTRLGGLAEVLDVDVGSEAGVVGEVPAGVVGVFVDDDVVTVPVPAVDVGEVEGGYAPVEAAEPEAGGAAAGEAPDVAGAEAGGEAAVLPGMVEVEAGIVGAVVVADPVVGFIVVRGVGMAFVVGEVVVLRGAWGSVVGFWAVLGDRVTTPTLGVSAATAAGVATTAVFLSEEGNSQGESEGQESDRENSC
jgi:hypothetical protein